MQQLSTAKKFARNYVTQMNEKIGEEYRILVYNVLKVIQTGVYGSINFKRVFYFRLMDTKQGKFLLMSVSVVGNNWKMEKIENA